MKLRLSPKLLLSVLLAGALFHACRDSGGPSGPADPADEPPVITGEPRDTVVTVGTVARFTVVAANATSYQWIRLPTDTLAGATSAQLQLTTDISLDSAVYRCVVRNAKGSVLTRPVVLRVSGDTGNPNPPNPPNPPAGRDCKADPVVFTEYLIDPALLKVVVPIGSLGGANTELVGRSYIHPKDGMTGQRLALRAPTDLEIVGVKHYDPTNGSPPPGYVYDWSLIFDAGCGVRMDLYHVKDVSPRIKAKYDTTISTSSAFNSIPFADRIKFKAGDTIGWYMTGPNAVAFDFIVHNDSVTNKFVNQARYVARNSNVLHTVCPYDFYTGAKKTAYYNLLGSVTGQPIPGAGCGTIGDAAFDGTPRGQWFFDSTFTPGPGTLKKEGYYGDPLPILYGPDSTIFIGHLGPSDNVRINRDNPTWLALSKVTVSYCYQIYSNPTTPNGWVWLWIVHPDKMNVAFGETGTCPTNFPSTGFRSYYR